MEHVYIVCEHIVNEYIPQPIDTLGWGNCSIPKIGVDWNKNAMSKIGIDWTGASSIKPKFDPILPDFTSKSPMLPKSKPNNIVCLCKDLVTAKHYLNGFPNRYILGPYNIM